MIKIKEMENEYLLSIPPDQKERARGIQGRKWDPQRRCWVYPRTIRMYNALVAEFGDDLTPESSFTSPEGYSPVVSPFLQAKKTEDQEAAELRKNVERIDQSLSELLKFLNTDNKRADILMRQERDIQSLRAELEKKDQKNTELHRQIEHLQTENRRLSNKTSVSPDDRDEIVKAMALEVTGNDPVFGEAIKNFQIDGTLPLQIANIIETHLEQLLDSDGTLYDLIQECMDDQILDEDSVSLAHSIRKQRNMVAHSHGPVDPRIKMGRDLFCLFAASLLFPKIPPE
jgi:hypothetical protein